APPPPRAHARRPWRRPAARWPSPPPPPRRRRTPPAPAGPPPWGPAPAAPWPSGRSLAPPAVPISPPCRTDFPWPRLRSRHAPAAMPLPATVGAARVRPVRIDRRRRLGRGGGARTAFRLGKLRVAEGIAFWACREATCVFA